jgi:hypothetical protein
MTSVMTGRQHLEAVHAMSVEGVRGGGGLVRAAAQQMRARRLHRPRRLPDLRFGLHGTRSGHHDRRFAADGDAPHSDTRPFRAKRLIHDLVRARDGDTPLDERQRFKLIGQADLLFHPDADDADDGLFLADRNVDPVAALLQVLDNVFPVPLGGAGGENDYHSVS